MKLVPKYIDSRITRALTRKVTNGGMPVVPPFAWNLAAAIPRFRDRRKILWRVNAIEPQTSPVDELNTIWDDVMKASGWAIPPQAVIWLWIFLQRTRPRRILELGSGISTLSFGTYASLSNDGVRIASVEHEPEWIDLVRSRLLALKLNEFVTQVHAPIVALDDKEQAQQTYDPQKIAEAAAVLGGSIDLALIDGPPAHTFGRGGTMESILPHLSSGAIVLLDDACRPHEYGLCHEWRSRFGRQIKWVGSIPIGHGIAVFTRR